MRTYIAGPMSGFENRNFEAFKIAELKFRDMGHEVVSPREIGEKFCGNDPEIHNIDYLREDLRHLLDCNAIALLPFWQESIGAKCEAAIALTMGFYFYDALSGVEIPAPTDVTIHSGYEK